MKQVLSPGSERSVIAKTLILMSMLFVAGLLSTLVFSSPLSARSRGISVVAQSGPGNGPPVRRHAT